jgi:hypothetical protein
MLTDTPTTPTTPTSLDATMANNTPGRSCPLHYRYSPTVFNAAPAPALTQLDVLYVVGGLYGNPFALSAIQAMFEEERGNKQMVFNGDFHWFDADRRDFDRIEQGVSSFLALRGNVETELITNDDSTGCGCAYPEWVDDGVVERSNLILNTLRSCVTSSARSRLASLPMWACATVGDKRLGIVHGDAESLAGWGFAQEHLQDPTHQERVASWFEAANIDIFASTHTCLPVMQKIGLPRGAEGWVINNGAAGMPNFRGNLTGLITRIGLTPYRGPHSLAHTHSGVHMDLLAVSFDQAAWRQQFVRTWPLGSDAHTSYMNRILQGPDYQVEQVIRAGLPC